MIGDGITDLEAATSADGFIGYGGVQDRTVARERAQWYIRDFGELIDVLESGATKPDK